MAAVLGLVSCTTKDKKTTAGTGDSITIQKDSAGNIIPITDSAMFTTLEWIDSTSKDLGKLKMNEEVEISWRFRNSGEKSLIIEGVTAACGCIKDDGSATGLKPLNS